MIKKIKRPEYDEKMILDRFQKFRDGTDQSRSSWMINKLNLMQQWDNYIDYPGDPIIKGQTPLHLPMTFQKIQAWHARMFNAIFSMDPIFTAIPMSKISVEKAEAAKAVMWNYLTKVINKGAGLKPVFDEMLWDMATYGWGFIYKRWEREMREIMHLAKVDVQELALEVEDMGGSRVRNVEQYEQVKKLVTIYDGIILETVPQERVYFPFTIPTSSDMNYPELVMIEQMMSAQEIESYIDQGIWSKEAGEEILEKGKGGIEPIKMQLEIERERLSSQNWNVQRRLDDYPIYKCFWRTRFEGNKAPCEHVFTVSFNAMRIASDNYLEEITASYRRPIYKFDLIKRPRSSYSLGFTELLYPYNREQDDFHNIRRASGLIANVPWGVYRGSGGLEKEPIEIFPGMFMPVDDPSTDINPMNRHFGNVTGWALQEEVLCGQYADTITSMPPMTSGQLPSQIGPLRSTSGVNIMMQEASAPMNVQLERVRQPINTLINDIYFDLQKRLPDTIVLQMAPDEVGGLFGDNAQYIQAGENRIDRSYLEGDYNFILAANDPVYNPERDLQNAMANLQLATSQLPVQMGVVNVTNVYNLLKEVFKKRNVRDYDKFLTPPPKIMQPLNLFQEFTMAMQGKMPVIVLNDDHQAKIIGFQNLLQSPEVQQSLKTPGAASANSVQIIDSIMNQHAQYLQILQGLQNPQNTQGNELPPTMGARASGAVNNVGERTMQPQDTTEMKNEQA